MNNKLLQERILLNPNTQNDMDYGMLKRIANSCSFLNTENLCELQLQFGHESLCSTCRSYPRINNVLGTEVERSLAMSCPEVVHILLELEEGLDFEIIEDNNHYNVKKYIANDIADIVFTIRLICIQLMQDRRYSIEERLRRIGLFIEGFITSTEQLTYLQQDYEHYLNQHRLNCFSESNKLTKIKIAQTLISYMLEKGNVNERYKLANQHFTQRFSGTYEELLEIYYKAERQYTDYMEKYSYQLENILVNLIFQEIFPFDYENIFESYCILLFRFGIIKSKLLNGAINEELTIEKVHLIVQTYFKAFDHNNGFVQEMYKIFYKEEPSIARVMEDFLS